MDKRLLSRGLAMATTSALALMLAMASQAGALAQPAQNQPQTAAPPGSDTVDDLVVTGTRASLQSAIDRKKNANTTVDSIVAEDIAQFPDKNIGEALQRITGVSLQRDFGEGAKVSIRGVEPDLNRVEINGMSVLSNDGTGNRAASFQELAAELVQSIDVIKGYTADMTEGGLGGTVSIRTRRPLDLRKPFMSLTASAQYMELIGSTKPRGNFTAGRKWWDGRLGLIANITYSDTELRNDYLRGTSWARFSNTSTTYPGATSASAVLYDYDNSPEKTFTNPTYASAATKADCPAGTSTAALTCLAQWNDFLPMIPRYGIWERREQRTSGLFTGEFRATDHLRLFAEANINKRKQHLTDYNFQFDAGSSTSPSRVFARTYDRNGAVQTLSTATSTLGLYPGAPQAVVDANHNVIDFQLAPYAPTTTTGSASNFTTQHRDFNFDFLSTYYNAGFNYKTPNFILDGVFGTSRARSIDDTNLLAFSASLPNVRVQISPTGAPVFTPPAGYSFDDPATYVKPALQQNGTPYTPTSTTPLPYSVLTQYQPKEFYSSEDTGKIDGDWFFEMPFLYKFEAGYQYRQTTTTTYQGAGYTTYDPNDPTRAAIYVQSPNRQTTISIDNGAPTGFTTVAPPITTPGQVSTTARRVTSADLLQFLTDNSKRTPGAFYSGAPDPGIAVPMTWFSPDAQKAASSGFLDLAGYNHDLVRRAPGRNAAGVVVGQFDQLPTRQTLERVHAFYEQLSYRTDLFGMKLHGNFGLRTIKTEVAASGALTNSYRTSAGGTVNTANNRTILVDIKKSYWDRLPSFNAALDVTDKLVIRAGYAKLLSRPKVADLVPSGTCTVNDYPDAPEDACSLGNPGLEPYRATQYDLGVGYYFNRDTLISVAAFYKDVDTFILPRKSVGLVDLFGDGVLYDVTQPVNGQGAKIQGVEISAQTAFTFLPAPWDGFGVQANYTFSEAKNVGLQDPTTFEDLPFPGLSRDTYNLIVYYEKGPLSTRLAYNGRSTYMTSVGTYSGLYRDPTNYLDGKVTWRFKNGLSVFLEGQNLTGEIERSTAGQPTRLLDGWYSGRRFFMGATFRY